MKYLVFVIISVVSSCFASINAQVAEAAEAMNNKDYPKAIAIYNSILEAV